MGLDMYIPHKKDIITIDFDPSSCQEIKKRRPALVISNSKYSELTNLVFVCPITHAKNNRMLNSGLLVKVDSKNIDGYVNPLQCHTFDYQYRNADYVDKLDDDSFDQVSLTINDIINASENS